MPMSIEEILALPAAVPPRDISEALGIALDSAYAGIKNGDIPALPVGRLKFVPKTWLLEKLGITPQIQHMIEDEMAAAVAFDVFEGVDQ